MTAPRLLAAAALLLGLGAAVVGSPDGRGAAAVPVDRLVDEIEIGADRIGPVELAHRLRDRDPALRIVDLRGPEAFEDFTVPQARNVPVRELVTGATFEPDEEVVLVSDGGASAAQAWALLRMRGDSGAVVLDGGVAGWLRTVLMPSVPADPDPDAQAYWEGRRELTEYFGGTPREVSDPEDGEVVRTDEPREVATDEPAGAAADEVEQLIREGRDFGCGW